MYPSNCYVFSFLASPIHFNHHFTYVSLDFLSQLSEWNILFICLFIGTWINLVSRISYRFVNVTGNDGIFLISKATPYSIVCIYHRCTCWRLCTCRKIPPVDIVDSAARKTNVHTLLQDPVLNFFWKYTKESIIG